jgi:hypothetical protein
MIKQHSSRGGGGGGKAFLKGQSEVFFRLLGTLAGTVLLVKAAFPPDMSFVLRQPNKTRHYARLQ